MDIYADEGITDISADKRADFQQLLADWRKGPDKILVKSISRLTRSTKEHPEAIRELKHLATGSHFKKENISTSTISGKLITAFFASFAQTESKSTSGNMHWSIQKRTQNGTYIPHPLYGYVLKTPTGYCYLTNIRRIPIWQKR